MRFINLFEGFLYNFKLIERDRQQNQYSTKAKVE